jgi:hypothetical protein
MIFLKSLNINADSSIRCNFESDSNVIDASDSYLEKQDFVNQEIDDEIHAQADCGEQRKSSIEISISPLHIVILQENAIIIFVALRCEAHVFILVEEERLVLRPIDNRLPIQVWLLGKLPHSINCVNSPDQLQ